jgi:cytoskeletal protein RodZ
MENVRKKLREARMEMELTIEEAAEAAGVKLHIWRYFEWNGRKIPQGFKEMCESVGLDPVEILKEEGIL